MSERSQHVLFNLMHVQRLQIVITAIEVLCNRDSNILGITPVSAGIAEASTSEFPRQARAG